ncbi:hypothetical protein OIDMADRAFT_58866 [Oidiodendron maius Zn]|uniref:Uncharacterized protein n=1 Tax=Oidiodendron maius (strain Zn) TaxID=913774 RepID=A0A0C3CC99_OIDMZ|nr:hypothetical protein OIDMADRAFT_58866 [Oidiodendron maius Zn]
MDAMDDQRIGDIDEGEKGQLSQEDATPAAHDHLLAPGKQQSHENTPTPLPVISVIILSILLFLPFLITILSFPVLISLGQDPLGFSFLAFLLLVSLVPCGLGISLLIFSTSAGIDPTKLPPNQRKLPGALLLTWSLLIIYLIFYGTVWIWASSRTVADLIDDHGVWKDFSAKVDVPDALDLLTRCLLERGEGWAVVEDFTFCAKDIGIKSAGD